MALRIISGVKGSGKTSFLLGYASRLVEMGRDVGGFAAPAVFEGDRRIGYDLLDLRGGGRRPLARVADGDDGGSPTVGMYRFAADALVAGGVLIAKAVRERFDVVAIDEVGPLEFRGEGWASALVGVLAELQPEQELLVVVRPALVDELAERFPSPWWASAERIVPPWPEPVRGVMPCQE